MRLLHCRVAIAPNKYYPWYDRIRLTSLHFKILVSVLVLVLVFVLVLVPFWVVLFSIRVKQADALVLYGGYHKAISFVCVATRNFLQPAQLSYQGRFFQSGGSPWTPVLMIFPCYSLLTPSFHICQSP